MERDAHRTAVLVPVLVSDDNGERDVDRAIYGWLAEYPTRTRRNYACMLKQWITFCQERRVHPFRIRREEVAAYARSLEDDGDGGQGVGPWPGEAALPLADGLLSDAGGGPELFLREASVPTGALDEFCEHALVVRAGHGAGNRTAHTSHGSRNYGGVTLDPVIRRSRDCTSSDRPRTVRSRLRKEVCSHVRSVDTLERWVYTLQA